MNKDLDLTDRKVGEPPEGIPFYDFVGEDETSSSMKIFYQAIEDVDISNFNFNLFEKSLDELYYNNKKGLIIKSFSPLLYYFEENFLNLDLENTFELMDIDEKVSFIKFFVKFFMTTLPNKVLSQILENNNIKNKVEAYSLLESDAFRDDLIATINFHLYQLLQIKGYIESNNSQTNKGKLIDAIDRDVHFIKEIVENIKASNDEGLTKLFSKYLENNFDTIIYGGTL